MPKDSKKLKKYREMRSTSQTPEPFGGQRIGGTSRFVVQQHAARRLHYDFRLEFNGVLVSWAVPKGPSPNPKDKRLAVKVEDHPIEYADFEGTIPEENYGAGEVIVWDRGLWQPQEDPHLGLEKGKLLFELRGHKLQGVWTLVKIKKSEKDWLLIKERDAYICEEGTESYAPQSVLSGLSLEEKKKHPSKEAAILKALHRLKASKTPLSKIAPLLATAHEKPFNHKAWVFEAKYDGYRILAHKVQDTAVLLSRNGNDLSQEFPEVLQVVQCLPYEQFTLDGEIVVLDEEARPSFRLLQKRVRLPSRTQIQRASIQTPATYFLFDLLGFGPYDLRSLPLTKRKNILQKVVPPVGTLRYSEHFPEKGIELYEQTVRLKLEGIIAKKADSIYQAGRSKNWLKIRADRTGDFVIVGFTAPKRSRQGLGALLLGIYEGKKLMYCGRVGTGFSDDELKNLRTQLEADNQKRPPCHGELPEDNGLHWVKPKLVVEVRYKQWNDVLRLSTFIRIREDKLPKECVRIKENKKTENPVPTTTKEKPPSKNKTLQLSNLSKIFWPEDKITKGELIEYYRAVSPWLLRYLKNRPVMLTRYPDGIQGKSFYQKDAPVFTPEWIRTLGVWSEHSEREIRYFVCEDLDSLLYVINLGAIPLHIWASSDPQLGNPDWCVLDLDPKQAPFAHVVKLAQQIHRLSKKIKLPSYVKTTGSTGLHVLFPLNRLFTHEQSKTLGELLATAIAKQSPEISTLVRNPALRDGKVYLDYLQNGHGKTIAAPFCVRPLPGAPVSMPLEWSEVNARLKPQKYTLKNALRRMKKLQTDPLANIFRARVNLHKSLEALSKILQE